jgi:hypothetical protein
LPWRFALSFLERNRLKGVADDAIDGILAVTAMNIQNGLMRTWGWIPLLRRLAFLHIQTTNV